MAVKTTLTIEIGADGKMKILAEGFEGPECEAELKPLEKAMGVTTKKTRTAEYYRKRVNAKASTSTK